MESFNSFMDTHSSTMVFFIIILFFFLLFLSKIDRAITSLMRWKRSEHRRDARRVFTRSEKNSAMALCKNRCEGTGVFFRCQHVGKDLHGDHWFPHSRGGATSIVNLVMLCPTCNKRKSDKIPSRFQTWGLRLRRKYGDYLPGIDTKVGSWLPYMYRNDRQINRK